MKIRGMHIDGYGRFVDYRIEELSPGLTIFLGQNEAGKSTLLAFIRAILFGFPEGRSAENRYTLPGRSQHGGRLFLEDENGTPYTLHRHSGKKGGRVQVFRGDKEGDALTLQGLLGSAGKGLFRNVFAFSLGELQQFETLNDQEVTSALYSAGLGTSAAKMSKLDKDLKSRADELFKPSGSKPEINVLLRQLEEIKAEKAGLLNQAGKFEELTQTLERLKRQSEEVGTREQALISAEMGTERLLAAWPTWAKWSSEQERLDSLPAERLIPADSLPRLTALLERLSELQQREMLHLRRLEKQTKRLGELPRDESLLNQGETIRRLAGHRTEWGRLRQALPGHLRQEEELQTQLRHRLTEIHPDWQIETLKSCDISVGRYAAIRTHQVNLSTLSQEELLGKQRLTEANKERQIARQQLDEALEELAFVPEPDTTLQGLQESVLSDLRGQWRQSAEQARRAEEDHKIAAATVTDGLEALGPGWTPERVKRTDAHRDHSQKALEHREAMTTRREQAVLARSAVQALERQLQALGKEREAVSAHDLPSGSRSVEQIEALRERLFTSRADLLRREKLRAAVDQGRAQTLAIGSSYQGLPIWLAGAIALCGLIVAVALAYNEHTNLALFVFFFMLIVAGAVHAVRAAAVARDASSVEDQAKRHQAARDELVKAQSELVVVEQSLSDAAAFLGFSSIVTSDELDRLDRSLTKDNAELERRQSRLEQVARLEQRVADTMSELEIARQEQKSAEDDTIRAQQDWQLWLSELGLAESLSPDTARELLSNVQRLADSIRRLERVAESAEADRQKASADAKRLVDILQKAGRTFQQSHFDDQITSFISDVRAEADKAGDRAQLQRRVTEEQRRLERAEERCQELAQSLQASQAALEIAEEEWKTARVGLPATTPGTALEILQRARAARELLDRAQAESVKREEAENSLERMYEDIRAVFREVGRQAPAPADLLSDFDRLLFDLQQHEKAEDERATLQREAAASASDLEAVVSDLAARRADVQALYTQAGVEDEASYRESAEIEHTRAGCRQAIHNHLQALTVAAGGADLPTFIHQLESSNTDELQLSLTATREERSQVSQQRSNLLREQGRVQSELEAIQASDALPNLRLREEMLKEQLRERAGEWAALALADSLLEEARKTFERERQPDVLVRASAHFSRMTDGRYTRLVAPPGDSKVVMETATGSRRESQELSRGTAEQAYLALRLGFVHEFSRRSEPLPMVMDDIFVNFDPERAKAAMREILTLTDRHQVLLFTCHPETVERVREVHPQTDVRSLAAAGN